VSCLNYFGLTGITGGVTDECINEAKRHGEVHENTVAYRVPLLLSMVMGPDNCFLPLEFICCFRL
jgi:hypothetical protein